MSNKLIPKMQWAGNIYYNSLAKLSELIGKQSKKVLDQYKDTENFLKNLYQEYYKEHMHDAHPLSFEHWVNRETGNSPEATVGPTKSVLPSLWDKIIHAGEYGDSGNGPSISNVVNSPVGTVLSFTPLGFATQAIVNLPSKEGVRKTINDVKNRDYLDAVGSGIVDALDMTGVGHGVKKAAKAGLLGKGLATSLAIDDAVKTGVTYAPDGTLLFANPSFNKGNVIRRVTSPQEALNTSMIGTWADPNVMTKSVEKKYPKNSLSAFSKSILLNADGFAESHDNSFLPGKNLIYKDFKTPEGYVSMQRIVEDAYLGVPKDVTKGRDAYYDFLKQLDPEFQLDLTGDAVIIGDDLAYSGPVFHKKPYDFYLKVTESIRDYYSNLSLSKDYPYVFLMEPSAKDYNVDGLYYRGSNETFLHPKAHNRLEEILSTIVHENSGHSTESLLTPATLRRYFNYGNPAKLTLPNSKMRIIAKDNGIVELYNKDKKLISKYDPAPANLSLEWNSAPEVRATLMEYRFDKNSPLLTEFEETPVLAKYNGYGVAYEDYKKGLLDLIDNDEDRKFLRDFMDKNLRKLGKLPVALPAVAGGSYMLNKEKDSSDYIK